MRCQSFEAFCEKLAALKTIPRMFTAPQQTHYGRFKPKVKREFSASCLYMLLKKSQTAHRKLTVQLRRGRSMRSETVVHQQADQVTALAPRARPRANAPFDAGACFRDTSLQRA